MATLMGVVSRVVGEVFAVASDGTRRSLLEGDRVFAGERLITGVSGAVAVTLPDGREVTLGRDSSTLLDGQWVTSADTPPAGTPANEPDAPPSQAELTDVERLQAAIEAGVDPTQAAEATAAGPGAGAPGGAGGGHSFVMLGEVGGALEPVIGFPTEGLAAGPEFPEGEVFIPADFGPEVEVVFEDDTGTVITGPGVVDEAALNGGELGGGQPGSNPGSTAETAVGTLIINSPDGVSRIEVLDANGVWVNVQGGGVVQGLFGTLSFDAAGRWTYTLSDNSLEHGDPTATGADDQLFDTFSVRVFDLDNDVSPVVPLTIAINDDGPSALLSVAEQGGTVVLDETAGLQADSDDVSGPLAAFAGLGNVATDMLGYAVGSAATVAGTYQVGADEVGASAVYSLALGEQASSLSTTAGSAIVLSLESGLIVGRDEEGQAVFAVAIDPSSGVVSVVQYASLQHPDAASGDEAIDLGGLVRAVLTVTDGDGDQAVSSVDIGEMIRFEDDAPSAAIQLNETGWVRHDETAGLQTGSDADDTDNGAVAALFDGVANVGSDLGAVNYAQSTSPVVDSSASDVGQDDEGATSVLSLAVVGGNGVDSGLRTTDGLTIVVSLEGELVVGRILDGPQAGTAAFAVSLGVDGTLSVAQYVSLQHPDGDNPNDAVDLAGKVQAVFTLIDGDGDIAVDRVDIGGAIRFVDDGPRAEIQLNPGVSVVHDETAGLQNAEATPTPAGDADDHDSASTAVAAQFAELSDPASGFAFGYAQSTAALVTVSTSSAGQDGEGAGVNVSLEIVGGDGVDSGLKTSEGQSIVLRFEEGLVVGRIAEGSDAGKAAFAVALGADGRGSIVQYVALQHPDTAAHDEAVDLAGKLNAVVTVTDGDRDVAIDRVGIGSAIRFEDDGPSAGPTSASLLLDDGGLLDSVATSTSGVLDFSAGADGLKSIALSGPSSLGSETVTSTWDATSNTLTISSARGPLVTVVLTDPASGAYTVTLLQPLQHELAGVEDDSALNIDYTVTDGDNDTASGQLLVTINDDVPTAGQTVATAVLDDEGLAGGINGGVGDATGAATSTSGVLNFSAGADGLKSIALSGPSSLGGETVTSSWDATSNTLTISSARGPLVTVVLTDPASGAYTVTLLQPLQHELAGVEDDSVLSIGYTVTDADNDTASGQLLVTINDDTPTLQAGSLQSSSSVTFQGTDAGYLNSYGYYTKAADGSPQSGVVIWANVKDVAQGTVFDLSGLDPADTGFFIIPNGGANSALADGTPLTFQLVAGSWQAFAGSTPLIGADGANVLFSDASLNPGGAHVQDTPDLGNQNWEDKTSTADWDYNDVNVSVAWNGQLQVDESDFSLNASRDFSGVFTVQPGADGQRSLSYELTLAAANPDTGQLDSGLVDSLSGQSVYLSLTPAGVVEGRTSGGELVFSVSVNAAGVVVLDQSRAIIHPTSDPDEPKSLLADVLGLRATVTDNDGDAASSSLDLGQLISFKDDGPLAIDDAAATLIEGGAITVASGNVLSNDLAGADGGKAFVNWNTSANGAAMNELAKYGALVLDPATGQYSFTLNNNDPDTIGLSEGQIVSQRLQYTMRDVDGDISTAFLTVTLTGRDNGVSLGNLDVQGGEVLVDEQHLANGSAPDSAALTQTGSFSIEAADGIQSISIGGSPAFRFAQLQGASAGSPLLIDSPAGVLAITGFVGTSSGGSVNYSYSLQTDSQHPTGNGENSLTEQFTIIVNDRDGDTATGQLDVTIIDDVPTAKDNLVQISEAGRAPVSLTLILDSSGSMRDQVKADLDGDGTPETVTRLDVAKAALVNLINSYVALGVPLNFKVIDFDSVTNLAYEGSDPVAAQAAINGLSEGGNTHYDKALNLARSELEADLANPALDGYVNRVYFLSDGEPYPSGYEAPDDWQGFVDANSIDVITVGIQIPLGGQAEREMDKVGNTGDSVIVVQDPDELSAALVDTVPQTLNGNVIDDAGPDGVDVVGADGPGSVTTISYTNAAGELVSVSVPEGGNSGPLQTQLGGVLTISSDGSYSYQAPANVSIDVEEVFTYTLIESDGDTSSAKLIIAIADSVPVARDNYAGVSESGLPPISLTLVLDSSGSMRDQVQADLDGDGTLETVTRLDVAKAALVNLINSYVALGVPLNFKVIDFDSVTNLAYEGSNPVAAQAAINSLSEGGNTHYDKALNLARSELEADLANPALDGYINRVYFLSDGEPYPSGYEAPDDWQGFVDANGINVITVGIQIPLGGEAEREMEKVGNAGDSVIVVQDPNELAATLSETVPSTLTGNVILDDGPQGVDVSGTDAPVSVTSVSYTNALGEWVTVSVVAGGNSGPLTTELGGTLVISSDGAYTYAAPRDVSTDAEDTFSYTITDRDGDSSTANLVISVADLGPVAYDNKAYVEQSGSVTGNFELGLAGWQTLGHVQDQGYNNNLRIDGLRSALVRSDGNAADADVLEQFLGLGAGSLTAALHDYEGSTSKNLAIEGAALKTTAALKAGDEVSFQWNFVTDEPRSADADDMGAFYISNGVDSRLVVLRSADDALGSGSGTGFSRQSGVNTFSFTLPSSWAASLYTLAFVTVDDYDDKTKSGLVIDNVEVNGATLTQLNQVTGNLLLDPNNDAGSLDPLGARDNLHDNATLYSVSHDGVEYLLGSNGVEFATALGGVFSISAAGGYVYTAAAGVTGVEQERITYTVRDQDGDLDSAQLTINVAEGVAFAPQVLTGNNSANTLVGDGNDDVLSGLGGNDTLRGLAGDDLLIGGAGSDDLYGGSGADTFQWLAGHGGADQVFDFSLAEGDRLDLRDLLSGERADAGSLDDYLFFQVSGGNTLIGVSPSGSGAPSQSIELVGVDLSEHYLGVAGNGVVSAGQDTAGIINGLLGDGALQVDTV